MSTKVDLRGRHDLGEIIGYAYRVYLANFATLFAVALITVPLSMLMAVLQDRIADPGVERVATAPIQLVSALVTLIATGGIIYAVDAFATGTRADASRSLDAAFERLGALLTSNLLAGIIVIAALFAAPAIAVYWLLRRDATIDGRRDWFLAIVPGALAVYLTLRWTLSAQAVMIEGKRNWAALDASAASVRDCWWRTLGVFAVVLLIAMGPTLAASPATLLPVLPATTILSVVFALVIPFVFTAQTLLYYDLKARKQTNADDVRAD